MKFIQRRMLQYMEIRQGYSYHIKDEFFDKVQDKYLMSNKENGNYCPHLLPAFLCNTRQEKSSPLLDDPYKFTGGKI